MNHTKDQHFVMAGKRFCCFWMLAQLVQLCFKPNKCFQYLSVFVWL